MGEMCNRESETDIGQQDYHFHWRSISESAIYACVRTQAYLQIQTAVGYWLPITLYRPIMEATAKCMHTLTVCTGLKLG